MKLKTVVYLVVPLAAVLLLIALALHSAGPTFSSEGSPEHGRLDLSRYVQTFSDEFDNLDVSASSPTTKWTAHTPYGGDFGDAAFSNPEPGFPFFVKDGILTIQARKGPDGKWRSGLLSSAGPGGTGFSQKFGYFEIRAQMPEGPGVWPAFWLLGLDRTDRIPEIDVVEYYGNANDRYHSVLHVWANDKKTELGREQITNVDPFKLTARFNTYGVDVQADWTTFYLNGDQVWRTKSEPEFSQPLYILINLALGSGWPIDKTPNPSDMRVDYVRAYALK
jgi:beta-glucanase (GH16 family)